MTWDNDDLAAFIRRANPLPDQTEVRPSSRHLAVRDDIMRPAATVRPGHRPLWAAVWAPIVALAVILLVVLVIPPAEKVQATTPPPLEFRDEGHTLMDVIATARGTLAVADGPTHPTRVVRSTGWFYQTDAVDSDSPRRVISPEVTTLQWNSDLSGFTRTTAGDPYWSDGSHERFPRSTVTPGTLLWELTFAPGDFQTPVVTPPGSTDEDMLATLRAYGLADERSAFDVMNTIDTLMEYWTLTDAQHASLLNSILRTDDARLLGATTDRAGRPVVGIAAILPTGVAELHLLISQETGRIVGAETYTLKADPPFPGEAIISYRIWDLTR